VQKNIKLLKERFDWSTPLVPYGNNSLEHRPIWDGDSEQASENFPFTYEKRSQKPASKNELNEALEK
jgi:hypothetical protein